MHSILSFVLFALPISGLDLALDESAGPGAAVPTQESPAQQEKRVIWSTGEQLWLGALKEGLPTHVVRIFSLPESAFEEELARIRLEVLSRGEYEKAIEESQALWMRVARSATRDSAWALTRCVALRAWTLREAGQLEAALAAAHAPFPTVEEIRTLFEPGQHDFSIEGGSELWTYLAEALWVDPEVSEIRESIQLASDETDSFVERCRERMGEERYRYVEENFGLPTDEIADLVLGLLPSGGPTAELKNLGSPAVATIAFVALADPDAIGFPGLDSISSSYSVRNLMDLDRMRALRLLTDWFDAGESVWHEQILDACRRKADLGEGVAWVPFPPPMQDVERIGGRPWTPEWTPLLARLIADEQTRGESLRVVHYYAKYDAFTPELQESLGDCIASEDQLLASRVLGVVADQNLRVPSAFPVYVAGLESPFPDIRRACAWQLSSFAAVEELLPFHRDRDPEVRQAVARVLRPVELVVRRGSLNQYSHDSERVTLTPERIPVIQALLADGVPAVVQEAEESIGSMDVDRSLFPILTESSRARARCIAVIRLSKLPSLTPAERGLVERLLHDPDPVVRIRLARSWEFEDSSLWDVILGTLARDDDPEVLGELDLVLMHTARPRLSAKMATLGVIPVRLTNSAAPFEPFEGGEAGWLRFAKGSSIAFEEAPFLLALALERGYNELVAHQLDSLITTIDSGTLANTLRFGNWLNNVYTWARLVDRVPVARRLRDLDPSVRIALYTWCDTGPKIGGRDRHRLRQALVDYAMLRSHGADDEAALQAIGAGDLDHPWIRKVLSATLETPERVALRLRIFRDETMPVALRLAAGTGIDALSRPEGQRLLDSMLEAAAKEAPSTLGNLLRGAQRGNEYLLHVMNEKLLADGPLLEFVDYGFVAKVGKPGTDAAAIAILDRYLEAPGEELSVVRNALRYLGEGMLVYEHPAYILAAARDPRYVESAIDVMEQRRLPEFVEPLCGVFRRDWPALTAENIGEVRCYAAQALSEYGGRESIEFLSSILFEVEGDVRASVVEALENLKRYEELRATWRTSPLPERDEALVELVSMLDSDQPPIRAAAARGLAAFGAIEAIPRLIRLLEDDSEVVRTAAGKALERLYELPVEVESEGETQEGDGESEEG